MRKKFRGEVPYGSFSTLFDFFDEERDVVKLREVLPFRPVEVRQGVAFVFVIAIAVVVSTAAATTTTVGSCTGAFLSLLLLPLVAVASFAFRRRRVSL